MYTYIFIHTDIEQILVCACGCDRVVDITGDRCCQCGNVMYEDHQTDGFNACCTRCGPIFKAMQRKFEKRKTQITLKLSFDDYEPELKDLEDVRVVCFKTAFDKSSVVKYTNYEEEKLCSEPSIRINELVSVKGLYLFFQNWAKNKIDTSKGSTEPKDLNEFLFETVLAHEEFRGTSIMNNGFTYSHKKN